MTATSEQSERAGAPAKKGLYGSDTGANILGAPVAEVVGTAILVFVGTAVAVGALLSRGTAGAPYDSLAVALAFGLILAALVSALGHVSGAHLNPAVTVALAATGRFPRNHVLAYVTAQTAGGVLGALATWITLGGRSRSVAHLAATYPAPGVGAFHALVVEALITFILVFVVISVATDERAPAATAGIAVGFALAAGVFAGGPITGGAVNPARTLGPMIVSGKLTDFWLYILGPILGAVSAALLYDRFFANAEAPA